MPSRTNSAEKMTLTPEARRLGELARAVGLGDLPDTSAEWNRAVAYLGAHEETPLLVDVLRWQGSVFRDRGETAQAERLYERSRRAAIALGYHGGHAHALNCLGAIAQRRGDMERAKRLYHEGAAIAAHHGESR